MHRRGDSRAVSKKGGNAMDEHKWKLFQLAVRVVATLITGIDIPL